MPVAHQALCTAGSTKSEYHRHLKNDDVSHFEVRESPDGKDVSVEEKIVAEAVVSDLHHFGRRFKGAVAEETPQHGCRG